MNLKDILHTISNKSDAAESNLWYSIEGQMEKENLMRKSKNRRLRVSMTWLAALLGIVVIASLSYAFNSKPIYHRVTLAEIESMATVLGITQSTDELSVTLDWAYADMSQIVIAYTAYDAEGNPLLGSELPNGSLELSEMWEGMQYVRFGREPLIRNTDTNQQIVRFEVSTIYYASLDRLSAGAVDPRERPLHDYRLTLLTGAGGELYTSLLFNFEVPFRSSLFERHTDLPDYTTPQDEINEIKDSITEPEIYFHDFVITDSATSLYLCVWMPIDTESGLYFPGAVNMYVDGDFVEDTPIPDELGRDFYVNDYSVIEVDNYFRYNNEYSPISCGKYIWHIAFDAVPDTVRIEIPSLRSSQFPEVFKNEEERLAYIDLYAAYGVELVETIDANGSISSEQFPDSWWELELGERSLIQQAVTDAFLEQFPPEDVYTQGWEHSFEITESLIITPEELYHQVSVQGIEALATPLNLTQTEGDITVRLNWAYADANQIAYSFDLLDADSNEITGRDYGQMLMQTWILSPVTDGTERDYQPLYGFGQHTVWSDDANLHRVGRYPIDVAYLYLQDEFNAAGVDLSTLDNLRLQVDFYTSSGTEGYRTVDISHSFTFDIPFNTTRFEQDNALVNMSTIEDDFSEPVAAPEAYFNKLTISDSMTVLHYCMRFPQANGASFTITPNLYVDNQFIETTVSGTGAERSDDRPIVMDDLYYYNSPQLSNFCGHFIWHMAFDNLPQTIRVELLPNAESDYSEGWAYSFEIEN